MPKKNSYGRIVGLIILLTVLWGAFFLTQSLLKTGANENQWYVPKNATMVMKIDGRRFLTKGFTEVILDQKDNELIGLLMKTVEGEDGEGFGIEYRSETYFFSVPGKDGRAIMGFLMDLNDQELFTENVPTSLSKRQGSAANNMVGIILSDVNENPLSRKELNAMATGFLQKKSNFDHSKFHLDSEHPEVIQLWAADFKLPHLDVSLKDITIALDIDKDSVTLHGHAEHTMHKMSFWRWGSEDSDLHIQTAYLPDAANKTINEFMSSMGMNTPEISYLSLNHHYTESAQRGNVMVVPNFDATISFADTVVLEKILLAAEENGGIVSLTTDHFEFGGRDFYYKQLAPDQIYIGRNKLTKKICDYGTLLRISGSMKPFSAVKGSGFMTKMLQLSSMYTSSDKLFSRIDDVNFLVKMKSLGECEISGHICFTEGNSPIDAFLNFIMRSGMLENEVIQ
ncbi:MAG: hypothetical protein ACI837_002967 [Crocinitomicaceae bacterium]|jgi:hypothetical protein